MPKPRFFPGWYIVICGLLAHSMRAGLGLQTFGFFFAPMGEELGWNRVTLTGGLMAREIIARAITPAAGFALDRFGPRLLMAGSAMFMGASLICLSRVHYLWQFVLFFGVVGALGVPGLSYIVISPTLAKWFIRKRGWATGIATAGVNVGEVALTPLILFLITAYGWRSTWFVLGFLPWLILVPPALLWLRRQPEDVGLHPDGDDMPSATDAQGSPQPPASWEEEVSWTPRAALATRSFWLVLSAGVIGDIAVSGGMVHRIPYMIDMGFSTTVAATTFVIYGIVSFAAKLIVGFLADRLPIRFLAAAVTLGGAVGLCFIIEAKSVWQLFLGYGVVYGLTGGSLVVVRPLIFASYFGRRFQGSISGITGAFSLISGVGSPMFAAFVYDIAKSYQFAFFAFAGCLVISAILTYLARPPFVTPTSALLLQRAPA